FHRAATVSTGPQRPVLAVVDPGSYAQLAHRTGLGAYPQEALRADGDVLPALVSPELASGAGTSLTVTAMGLDFPVHPALVRRTTPAAPDTAFVVISRRALEEVRPQVAGSAAVTPNHLLLSGAGLDGAVLRDIAGSAGRDAGTQPRTKPTVKLRSEEAASYTESVLRSGAERLYVASVLLAAALSALAVVLSMAQTATERATLLTRLRALGMARRQGRWLILVEALPLYFLTAVAGVLLTLASARLLGPGIDLASLAGTSEDTPAPLAVEALPLFLPSLFLLSLTVAALLLQAQVATRVTDPHMEST
ncbi:hypothetical protein N566_27640, partial [Streptomycetaceae bacterium MP113-05]